MKQIARIFSYVAKYPWMAFFQLLCAILATALIVVFPGITRTVLDDVIPNHDYSRLHILLLMVGGAFVGREVFESLRIQLNNTFEQRVIFDLRSELVRKIQRLPLQWFDKRATGDIMTRVVEDVTSVERVIIDGIEQGLVAILQIFVVGAFMFWMDPMLASVACAPLPLLAFGALLYTSTARDRHRKVRSATSAMNSLLHDNVSGIRQIKAYAVEERELAHFNSLSNALRVATLRVMRVWSFYRPGMSLLSSLGSLLVIGFGAYRAMAGVLSPGDLAAFLIVLGLFYEPVGRLHSLNQLLQAGRAAGERVFEIIDSPEEVGLEDGEKPTSVEGRVLFDKVSFSYGEGIPTVKNVTIEAEPGQMIALVGQTGAGKSTLIHLLTRFYEYDGGEIWLDGIPVRNIAKESLRHFIGYVTQESFLFNGTIRDNMLFGSPESSDEDIWKALEAANAKGFVNHLTHGLDTEVGERGVRLSVGEKQRVSIARMILKNPPIILLDEATASVDATTEKLIQEALDHLMEKRTSFVIAHRLSTVRHADRIYVMDHGEVAEQGAHADLVAQNGIYARLCRESFLE